MFSKGREDVNKNFAYLYQTIFQADISNKSTKGKIATYGCCHPCLIWKDTLFALMSAWYLQEMFLLSLSLLLLVHFKNRLCNNYTFYTINSTLTYLFIPLCLACFLKGFATNRRNCHCKHYNLYKITLDVCKKNFKYLHHIFLQ